MAVTGWKAAGTGANDASVGNSAWSNPGNITASNNTRATTGTMGAGQSSQILRATNFGFTTSDIPSGSTIDGIEIGIERQRTATGGNQVQDSTIRLRTSGGQTGTNKAVASNWPSTEAEAVYGGSTDVWSTTYTDSDIRGSDFGVDIRCARTGGTAASGGVDHVRCRVYYTEPVTDLDAELVEIGSTAKEVILAYDPPTEVVRYVNTASSGGDGTTNATSGATAAYASLAAWAAAEATNLVTLELPHRVICTGGTDTARVDLTGWTTSADYGITIEVAEGSKHDGTVGGSSYRLAPSSVSTSQGVLDLNCNYVTVNDLVVLVPNSYGAYGIKLRSAQHCVFNRCIIYSLTSYSFNGGIGQYGGDGNHSFTANNCLVYNTNGRGFVNEAAGFGNISHMVCNSCTCYGVQTTGETSLLGGFIDYRFGYEASTSTTNLYNCLSVDNIVKDFATYEDADFNSSNWNISSDANAPGADSLQSVNVYEFGDTPSGDFVMFEEFDVDFHLVDIDGNVALEFTDITSLDLPTDDIDGAERTTDLYDCGCDQVSMGALGELDADLVEIGSEAADVVAASVIVSSTAAEIGTRAKDTISGAVVNTATLTEIGYEATESISSAVIVGGTLTEIGYPATELISSSVLVGATLAEIGTPAIDAASATVLIEAQATELGTQGADDISAAVLNSGTLAETGSPAKESIQTADTSNASLEEIGSPALESMSAGVFVSASLTEVGSEIEEVISATLNNVGTLTEIGSPAREEISSSVLVSATATEIGAPALDTITGEVLNSAALTEIGSPAIETIETETEGDLDANLVELGSQPSDSLSVTLEVVGALSEVGYSPLDEITVSTGADDPLGVDTHDGFSAQERRRQQEEAIPEEVLLAILLAQKEQQEQLQAQEREEEQPSLVVEQEEDVPPPTPPSLATEPLFNFEAILNDLEIVRQNEMRIASLMKTLPSFKDSEPPSKEPELSPEQMAIVQLVALDII